MMKAWGGLFALCLAVDSFSETQTIKADSGPNLIAVELQVGENRLVDLFPEAPVGTIIYKFDNAGGWSAAQKYPFGWSHPERKILVWEGAVMILPTNAVLNVTLSGDPVPLPTEYITLNSSSSQAHVYSGWNLISARLARHLGERRGEIANVHIYKKSMNQFFGIRFDELSNEWFPAFPPTTGAAWYATGTAPTPPSGSSFPHPDFRTAVYMNNYAPAYGLDRRFFGSDCQPLTNGRAGLRHPGGVPEFFGESVSFTERFPGYLDPSAHLVRYVPPDTGYEMFESGTLRRLTGPISIPQIHPTTTPPWPIPVELPPTVELKIFDYLGFRPGTNSERRVTLTGSISNVLHLNWQKQSADGEWIDLPGATNTTLRFVNMQTSDAGTYRVRAALYCEDVYSNEGRVASMLPRLSVAIDDSTRLLHITAYLPIAVRTKLQTSTDLKNWVDHSTRVASLGWAAEVPADDSALFYRVVEEP